jgi:hypothetical protein
MYMVFLDQASAFCSSRVHPGQKGKNPVLVVFELMSKKVRYSGIDIGFRGSRRSVKKFHIIAILDLRLIKKS